MASEFNFTEIRLALEKKIKELPKELAEIVKDDAVVNFYQESFNGKKWQAPKNPQDHPLMIDSGKLLSAVRNSVNTGKKSGTDSYSINVINSYGLFHNEGTDKIPQRQFIGETNNLDKKVIDYMHKSLDKLFEIK